MHYDDYIRAEVERAFAPLVTAPQPSEWVIAFSDLLLGDEPVDAVESADIEIWVGPGGGWSLQEVFVGGFEEVEDDAQQEGVEMVAPLIDEALGRLSPQFWTRFRLWAPEGTSLQIGVDRVVVCDPPVRA